MHTHDTRILRRLDDDWKLAIWDASVAGTFLVPAFFGVMRGTLLGLVVGVLTGFAAARWVSTKKAMRHQGFFQHWLHWHFPAFVPLRALPPAALREMVG